MRVTLFDADRAPLAERLVYRNHGRMLQIGLSTDQETYGPRDEVVLDVTTRDPAGRPVAAEVAIAVVDDKVLTFADDENGHMLTRLYLEPEVVDSPKDPAFYFDPDEPLAARAMDLVMGARGYRRFEWAPVWSPPVQDEEEVSRTEEVAVLQMLAGAAVEERRRPQRRARVRREAEPSVPQAAAPVILDAAPAMEPVEEMELDADFDFGEDELVGNLEVAKEKMAMDDLVMAKPMEPRAAERLDIAGDVAAGEVFRGPVAQARFGGYAPVRVFPAPDYRKGLSGPRTDFRDTVHWAPSVTTGAKGTAQVRFYLSDAVTAFRITAEGLGGGEAGHAEATVNSVLPVSIATRLPAAVSVGDRLELPVTLTSTRLEPLKVDLGTESHGRTLTLGREAQHTLTLDPQASNTHFVPIDVGAGAEAAELRLTASGGGLSDTVIRSLQVVPAGFPQAWSAAGEDATTVQRFELELTDVVDHSLEATATWHPSPVSSLIAGMEGLIRTPGGCFEQTSSTNWPNVAILRYLEAHDGDPRLRLDSAQALDAGYAKLTGYQVAAGGFETWGSGPGKEALSAFGLLQFADMAEVHDVAPAVLDRDVTYLLAQRDGKGGYSRTGESAHGYGSAPKPVLDGFITYALVETGNAGQIAKELDQQAETAATSQDPYVLALATRALLKAGRSEGRVGLKRLVAMQSEDGSFPGAESSITRSYEANLLVESTALA
ncbi:MAG: alpha-2-macroglobulin family protein, partial [Myxococcota bacterium]